MEHRSTEPTKPIQEGRGRMTTRRPAEQLLMLSHDTNHSLHDVDPEIKNDVWISSEHVATTKAARHVERALWFFSHSKNWSLDPEVDLLNCPVFFWCFSSCYEISQCCSKSSFVFQRFCIRIHDFPFFWFPYLTRISRRCLADLCPNFHISHPARFFSLAVWRPPAHWKPHLHYCILPFLNLPERRASPPTASPLSGPLFERLLLRANSGIV